MHALVFASVFQTYSVSMWEESRRDSYAFIIVVLGIGKGSVVLALRSLEIALRSLALLAKGAAPRRVKPALTRSWAELM
jgi:hypothetical protein